MSGRCEGSISEPDFAPPGYGRGVNSSAAVVPWSADLTVQETISRLAQDRRVRAVSFLGSTGTPEWTDASDVDLCLLLDDYGTGVGVERTIIEGRIADIVLLDLKDAESILRHTAPEREAAAAITSGQWPFVHWLAEARPVHDPTGAATVARGRAEPLARLHTPRDAVAQQAARRFLSHDVNVNANLLARSADPVLEIALGMRQLHTSSPPCRRGPRRVGSVVAGGSRTLPTSPKRTPTYMSSFGPGSRRPTCVPATGSSSRPSSERLSLWVGSCRPVR